MSTRRLTIEDVRSRFEARGYTLLEDTYKNSKQLLRFECPSHPHLETKIDVSRLMSGQGCRHCGYEQMGLRQRLEPQFVREEFATRGYTLLDEYTKSTVKMRYSCASHPDVTLLITYSDFQNGYGCTHCGRERTNASIKGEKHPQWKGGATDIGNYLRQLLVPWKLRALADYQYRCAVSGQKGKDIEIHHTIPFHEVRDSVLSELRLDLRPSVSNYTEEEMRAIADLFLLKHETIVGIPLKRNIHTALHKSYGYSPSQEDFIIFKNNYPTEVGCFNGKAV